MSGITSSTGLMSGLPTADLIDQLMEVEARPKNIVQNQVTVLQSQQSAYLEINARLLALDGSTSPFAKGDLFNQKSTNVSNDNVLTATASDSAMPGHYSMLVDRLVTTQQMISRGFEASDTAMTTTEQTITVESHLGRLDREVDLADLNGFTGIDRGKIRIEDRSGATATIDLSKAVTLDDVIEAINNSASIDVSAKMTGDGLVLTDQSGATVQDLRVENIGSNTTAEDLGIAGNSAGTNTIIGTQINSISDNTVLSALNDRTGIGRYSAGDDIAITGHNGTTFNVNLNSATTVGDVIELINTAASDAGSTVTASISSNGVGMTLSDSEHFTTHELAMVSINGSTAAEDLGFIRGDTNHDGTLVGERVLANLGSVLLKNINGGAGITMGQEIGASVLNVNTPIADLFDGAGLRTSSAGSDVRMAARDEPFVKYYLEVDQPHIQTVGDLIDEVDAATGGKLTLSIDGRALRITDNTGSTKTDLEWVDYVSASDVTEQIFGTANLRVAQDSVLGVDTRPLPESLSGYGPSPIRVTNRDGAITEIAMTDARSVSDVIDAINNAGAGITAQLNETGNGIKITDTTGGSGDLIIEDVPGGALAGELGIAGTFAAGQDSDSGDLDVAYVATGTRLDQLNGGSGVASGKFIITDSNGATATVDLTQGNEHTLADVIQEINSRPIDVLATINDTGDGLLITDTAGGSRAMTIKEDGSTTAKDLGILGTAVDNGANNFIDGSAEKQITIEADANLTDIANAINSAGVGITASVLYDGSGTTPYRLNLSSDQTGRDGRLMFDDGNLDLGVETLVEGDDAVVFYGSNDPANAMMITSSTNTLSRTIEGVTLDLKSTSDQPVQITIAQDHEAVVEAVSSFVKSFNGVIDAINKHDNYNNETQERGLLLGDPTALTIRSRLYNSVIRSFSDVTGEYKNLTSMGVTVSGEAKLSFDEEKLRAALASNPEDVENFFALKTQVEPQPREIAPGVTVPGTVSTTAQGFGSYIEDLLESFTDNIDGLLKRKTDSIDTQIELANQRIEQLDVLLEGKRTRLERQFASLETSIAQMQSQQSALGSLASAAASFGGSSSSG